MGHGSVRATMETMGGCCRSTMTKITMAGQWEPGEKEARPARRLRSCLTAEAQLHTSAGGCELSGASCGCTFGLLEKEANARKSCCSDRSGDGTRDKIVAHEEKGDERNAVCVDKSIWRHDGFYELESEAPVPREKPSFREKKITPESGNVTSGVAMESIKPTRFDRPLPVCTRRETKDGYHSRGANNKPERPHAETDERNTKTSECASNGGEARKGEFPSKERRCNAWQDHSFPHRNSW